MGTIKTIKPIVKAYSPEYRSLEASLAQHGFSRNPGAVTIKLPFKEANGKYRTGLDIDADYLKSWPKEEREAEIERIKEAKERLEAITGYDLSPRSPFYNYAKGDKDGNRVFPMKFDGTTAKVFNMDIPEQEITWHWLKVHPTIAPSLLAYQTGQVHPQIVEYYIADDAVEDAVTFKKKQALNKAIKKLDDLNEVPSKLRQVARLLDLPAQENVSQTTVYNMVDNLLKAGEFQTGEHKGANPINVFMELTELQEARAHVKDIVKQAIRGNIYRVRNNGRLYQGDNEVYASTNDLVNYLLSETEEAQEDLIMLEKKLAIKKIIEIDDQDKATGVQKPAKAK